MVLKDGMFRILSNDGNKAKLELLPNHPIYMAHFPGNPITPGVCIIKIIAELLEAQVGYPVALFKIVNLKFIAPISPVNNPIIDVFFSSIENQEDNIKGKGNIFIRDEIVTKFSIIYKRNRI